jgi:hypothetical protein
MELANFIGQRWTSTKYIDVKLKLPKGNDLGSYHLGWRTECLDIILKENHIRHIKYI